MSDQRAGDTDLGARRTRTAEPAACDMHEKSAMQRSGIATTTLLLLLSLGNLPSHAQERTVGLLRNDAASFEGYTLFAPSIATTTYLIDHDGGLAHSWESAYRPGGSAYLLENGDLLRTALDVSGSFGGGGAGGFVERYAWSGERLWFFDYSSSTHQHHHDVELLPNGNVLLVAWERKTSAQAQAAGRNPSQISQGELWSEQLVEVEPSGSSGGTVVWQWHAWDHLVQDHDASKANHGVVADHPELIDVNFTLNSRADWLHINSIDYDEDLDQVLVSVHNLSEIWVIDHSTTTGEAATHAGGTSGKGGDLLYRWGNPEAYGAGSSTDQQLFQQHDAHWIEPGLPGDGNILIFNNGVGRPGGSYSTVDEITPPTVDANGNYPLASGAAHAPGAPTWSYIADEPTDFTSPLISGAQRLANGNTLICQGPVGTFFEVTNAGDIVWEYVNPVTSSEVLEQGDTPPGLGGLLASNPVFRAYRYAPSYPGFDGLTIAAGDPIELYTSAPTAGFDASTFSPGEGEAVQFEDTSTGYAIGWLWDFGDGDSSTAQHPSHAYATSGSFQVTFTADNPAGESTVDDTITVATAIFGDDFENGNFAAWSDSAP